MAGEVAQPPLVVNRSCAHVNALQDFYQPVGSRVQEPKRVHLLRRQK